MTEPAGQTARSRIVDATIDCVRQRGVGDASMAAIAGTAGVSKALLHYHYADRARLLAEVATHVAHRLVERESAAIETAGGGSAVDAVWRWIESELARGELRALLELSLVREPVVLAATAAAARQRHAAAANTVSKVFATLGLSPRVPASLLGHASLAFLDGLALHGTGPRETPRVSFDIFWLGLLSLVD